MGYCIQPIINIANEYMGTIRRIYTVTLNTDMYNSKRMSKAQKFMSKLRFGYKDDNACSNNSNVNR